MKRIQPLLTALLFSIFAACSAAKPDLSGEWKLVSYGDAANPTPALPGVETSIFFKDGQMSGNVGCNGFGGEYKLDDNKIAFRGVMSTLMYCEETSAQEQGVFSVFSDNVPLQIQVDGDSLVIVSVDGMSVVTLTRK